MPDAPYSSINETSVAILRTRSDLVAATNCYVDIRQEDRHTRSDVRIPLGARQPCTTLFALSPQYVTLSDLYQFKVGSAHWDKSLHLVFVATGGDDPGLRDAVTEMFPGADLLVLWALSCRCALTSHWRTGDRPVELT